MDKVWYFGFDFGVRYIYDRYMETIPIEIAQMQELEERKRWVKSYEDALDIQFGSKTVTNEEKRRIFEQAAIANRFISLMVGEPIVLTKEEASNIRAENPRNFGQLLNDYKTGVEFSLGGRGGENAEEVKRFLRLGKEAALQLFGPENPNIQFV